MDSYVEDVARAASALQEARARRDDQFQINENTILNYFKNDLEPYLLKVCGELTQQRISASMKPQTNHKDATLEVAGITFIFQAAPTSELADLTVKVGKQEPESLLTDKIRNLAALPVGLVGKLVAQKLGEETANLPARTSEKPQPGFL